MTTPEKATTVELFQFLSAHANNPPYIPERDDVDDADVLREAIAHEAELHVDREVTALSLSLHLVTHPEVPVSTDADYPGWTPGGAA